MFRFSFFVMAAVETTCREIQVMPNNRGSLFWSAAPVSRSLTWQRETIGKHVVFKIQVKRVSKINNLQHKTSFPTLPELHSALNKNGLVVLNFSSS